MGHYGSEMEPECTEKRVWEIRERKLYEKIRDMGLGCFKVSELPSLLKLYSLGYLGFHANHQDITELEKAIARHEKLLALLPKDENGE